MQHSYMRGILLLALALILGFALMGFEMLGSRYLYPYFGGGINTWASLIATVLVALMLGYLIGGALVDRTMSPRLCGALLAIAGVYLFTIPLWVDPLFAWMLTSVGDGMAGIVLAATMLLLLPLTLMSVFTPFAVRLLLVSVAFGGRIVSYVYGVSTIGNVLGTLVTTFVLVPQFGSRALTMIFAARHHRLRDRHDAVRPVPARSGRVSSRWMALALLAGGGRGAGRARGGCVGRLSGRPDVARRPHLLHRDGRRPRHRSSKTARRASSGACRAADRPRSCGSGRPASWSTAISAGRWSRCRPRASPGASFTTNRDGQPLQDPNAAVSDGQGGAYFSDAGQFDLNAPSTGRVYHLSAMGVMTEVVGGIQYANGVNFDPATRTLYVSEHLARRVLALTIDGSQRVTARKVLIDFAQQDATRQFNFPLAGPDGIALRPGSAGGRRIRRRPRACLRPRRPPPEHAQGVDALRRYGDLGRRRQSLCRGCVPEHAAAL